MRTLRVLSLGAGVQSSTLALMIEEGLIPMVDCAIFADTQAESQETYKFLDWLKEKLSYPVHVITHGNLTDNLINTNFPVAPVFTKDEDTNEISISKRQCTANYKITPINKEVRKLIGLSPKQRAKKDTRVEMLMGISIDEISRMRTNAVKYINNVYPLIDMRMNRQDCISWFTKRYEKYHQGLPVYIVPFIPMLTFII